MEAANGAGTFDGCTATNADTDIINLTASTYVLTRHGLDDDNEFGDLDVLNEPLQIVGLASSGPSTIDGDSDVGSPDDRVLQVHSSVADGSAEDFGATGLVIRDGVTTGFGGGISIDGPTDCPCDPPEANIEMTVGLSLMTFTANRAELGGAIHAENAETVRVVNSTISANNANGHGGGLESVGTAANPALIQLANSTIANNTADVDASGIGDGGGVSARGAGGGLTLYNTIVAGNADLSPSGPVAPDCSGDGDETYTSGGYNLIGNLANCDGLPIGTGDVRDVPAGLAPLALIPGAGLTTVLAHDLTPTSPARDAGNPAPVGGPLGTCEPTAQNFGPRPQGARCDIGAVEADVVPPGGGGPGDGAKKKKCKKKKKKKSAAAAKKKKCKKKKRK